MTEEFQKNKEKAIELRKQLDEIQESLTNTVIIDGVNVAGCISFDKNNGYNICCYDDTREDKIPFANFCIENKNCYYKQLKRLEQENENLKKEVKQIGSDFIKKGDYARELEQENRELKAYKDINEDFKKAWDELNKKYTEVLKLAKENADSNEYCLQELEQENKELKEKMKNLESEIRQKKRTIMMNNDHYLTVDENNRNYRSALEEIREIVKQANKDICDNCGWHNTSECSPNGYLCHDLIEIKNKINEVLK